MASFLSLLFQGNPYRVIHSITLLNTIQLWVSFIRTEFLDWSNTNTPQAVDGNVYVAINRNNTAPTLQVNGVAQAYIKRNIGTVAGVTIYYDCYYIENLKSTDTIYVLGAAYAFY